LLAYINPKTQNKLRLLVDRLEDENGEKFPVIEGIPRFTGAMNYADNFGFQWNTFTKTQIDVLQGSNSSTLSEDRFFAQTEWKNLNLEGINILEAGSGAGRFSHIILSKTLGTLYSFDYSNAVMANQANNRHIAPDRFHLFQASIYEIPFPDHSFDKVICFGVLQHTPDFEGSIKSLISKLKPKSEIIVDFYRINGWWTKFHAKYFFRPLTRRLKHDTLLKMIKYNINWLMFFFDFLCCVKLGWLTRFLPIVDMRGFPQNLSADQRREWALLDTFDMFSPEYDNPQKIEEVVKMFQRNGTEITFAGLVNINGVEGKTAVIRAVKI
jgi:SAM-dependent methyltransferase